MDPLIPRKRPTRHDQMKMIEDAVSDMNKRRQWLADTYLPTPADADDTEYVYGSDDELTKDQRFGIIAITALEEEWIVDPQLRDELSVITYTDD